MRPTATLLANARRIVAVVAAALTALGSLTQEAAADVAPSFVLKWGSPGCGSGQFLGPFGIIIDAGGSVYVTDQGNFPDCHQRVQKFSRKGEFLLQWGSAGSGNGQFNEPGFMAFDKSGNLYVVDKLNTRVQRFTPGGVFLSSFPTASRPSGIAVDPVTDSVYVSSENCSCVQKFTNTGVLLRGWGSNGTAPGQFKSPQGMAVDAAGNLYVVDADNNRVQKFSSTGVFLMQFGSAGAGDGQFSNPQDIVIGPPADQGDLYVTDHGNHRIQKFSAAGVFITKWGGLGTGDGQLNGPTGICVDPHEGDVSQGNVYVVDSQNARVQRFGFLTIFPIRDVANDQGRTVRIRFVRSTLDVPASPAPITQYEAYRQIAPFAAPALARADARWARSDDASGELPADESSHPLSIQLAGWEFVGAVPAHGESEYNIVVPTLADSNGVNGLRYSVFFIRAATATPTSFVDSAPDSGYSVDNLPPAVPGPLTAAYAAGATNLHWSPNREADLWYYRVYRGASADFVPGPSNLIATRSDTGYADVGPAGGYYKLSAVDVNANESGFATIGPQQTTAVPRPPGQGFALHDVRPNPARGDRLVVDFGLDREGPASLELLDVMGRRLVAREVGSLGAGWHELDLASGLRLAPGRYVVRLKRDTQSVIQTATVVR